MEPKNKPKEKRRNNEKRKEKSRDAARCRRSRETEIFSELAGALPLQKDAVSQLDKASIMRLAISYLKVRSMITLLPEVPPLKTETAADNESVFLKALEGFLLVMSSEGDVIYVSENVNEYLGISQVDLMGQNIYEYSHPCDHDELKDVISSKTSNTDETANAPRSIFLRLKCTLTSKGRSVNLKSASYKVIHFTGHMLTPDVKEGVEGEVAPERCLLAIGQPIPHPSNIEIPLDRKTFLSKHSLDMKFTYADDTMSEVLGYEPEDLVGKPVYDYHHAMDSDAICSGFKSLFSKGQCETNRYRFLAKCGGYVWVVTQATLLHDKLHKPQSVVCVHYVISGIECKNEIYSLSQLSSVTESETHIDTSSCSASPRSQDSGNESASSAVASPLACTDIKDAKIIIPTVVVTEIEHESRPERPQTATSKIFAPRTEEMNKGFLMFSDDEPGLTVLKDEPDDLTHLAPVAGDVCVPIGDGDTFLSDVFNDFIFDSDNLGPLLTDDLNSLDSQSSKNSSADPFIAYREDFDMCSPSLSNSPHLLSPSLSKSPGGCSLPSLSSPGNSLADDDHLAAFMSLQMESEGDDCDLKEGPTYIPMNIGDDLPLLISDDLMWGALPDDKMTTNDTLKTDINSSLAQLLCQNGVGKRTLKANDHGGGLVNPTEVSGQIYNNNNNNTDSWKRGHSDAANLAQESPPPITQGPNNRRPVTAAHNSQERSPAQKRLNTNPYESINKRSRSEPKEKLSSELLHQLMLTTNQKPRSTKTRTEWSTDKKQISDQIPHQPSDSVLMNLLAQMKTTPHASPPSISKDAKNRLPNIALLLDNMNSKQSEKKAASVIKMRKNSMSLFEPDAAAIPSLLDLSEQDYDVNAPVGDGLLQGHDLLSALDITDPMC